MSHSLTTCHYLVSSSNVLFVTVDMDTLCDIRRLLLQRHQHIAGLVVKPWR